jgi:hypothetical protein
MKRLIVTVLVALAFALLAPPAVLVIRDGIGCGLVIGAAVVVIALAIVDMLVALRPGKAALA